MTCAAPSPVANWCGFGAVGLVACFFLRTLASRSPQNLQNTLSSSTSFLQYRHFIRSRLS
jgi:methyl coenzyme M reductase beta subunit